MPLLVRETCHQALDVSGPFCLAENDDGEQFGERRG